MAIEHVNKVILQGVVGRYQIRYFDNGEKVADFQLVTNILVPGKNGEPKIESTWHRNIEVWNRPSIDFKIIETGNTISLEGRLTVHKWITPSGEERKTQKIIVSKMRLVHKAEGPVDPKLSADDPERM